MDATRVRGRRPTLLTIGIFIMLSGVLAGLWLGSAGRQADAAVLPGGGVAPLPVPTQPTELSTQTVTPGRTGTPARTSTRTPIPATPSATGTHGAPSPLPTAIPTVCPMNFTDVSQSDWFHPYVLYLYCRGAISGYSDGTFRPYNNTTRGQLAKIVVGAEQWPLNTEGGPHFSDVPMSNPFYAYVETVYLRGVVSGYTDGTFRWASNVTRGQLSKIVVLAEEWPLNTENGPHFSDVAPGSPFYSYVETAFGRGVITGYADGTFRPGSYATRAQLCKVVQSALTAP